MNTLTLRNGAVHSREDTIFAMCVLENLRACDVFAFTKFIDYCRNSKSNRDVKPAIRDVAQSTGVGYGLDMRLVHPVRLRQVKPGQRLHTMQELWDLDLRQGVCVKLIGHHGIKPAPEFGLLWMWPPQLPHFALFAQIEMEDRGMPSAVRRLELRDFENPHTQVFIASPKEIQGRQFHNLLSASMLANQRAYESREVTSETHSYHDDRVKMTARFYRGLANACS